MKRYYTYILLLLLLSINTTAQNISDQEIFQDTVSISEKLKARMDSAFFDYDSNLDIAYDEISDNPLYYKLFMPIVLYSSVVSEAITPDNEESTTSDDEILKLDTWEDEKERTLIKMIDEALIKVYLEHPELVKMTESELMGVKGITHIDNEMRSGINLSDAVAQGRRPTNENNPNIAPSKPKYWKTFGNFQGKYTQSYYSDNWYKGGESNHSLLGQINIEAKYAKNQITFDNKLEMKLGYYTAKIDDKTTLKKNDDLIRVTSKFGLKAIKDWYYSAQFQGNTQFMDVYDTKDESKLKSKFMAPGYGNISIGMDYKPKFKNMNLSVMLSPLSYDCRYVSVDSIATSFGIDEGKKFKYTIGSRLETNIKWTFLKDFTLTSKLQYYSGYQSTEINIENTLDYKLSQYLSLQFFCHWRFDDSVKRKQDKDGNLMGYSQFKEFLTLNFNYAW